jgi:hypothetical protein
MSGGSFNYLCYADNDPEDLISHKWDQDIRRMITTLYENNAPVAAEETKKVLDTLEKMREQLRKLIPSDLAVVWKAVEWKYSCDTSKESMDKAIQDYEQRHLHGRG